MTYPTNNDALLAAVESSNSFHEDVTDMLGGAHELTGSGRGIVIGHSLLTWYDKPRNPRVGGLGGDNAWMSNLLEVISTKIGYNEIDERSFQRALRKPLGEVVLRRITQSTTRQEDIKNESSITHGIKLAKDPRTGLWTYIEEYNSVNSRTIEPSDRSAAISEEAKTIWGRGEPRPLDPDAWATIFARMTEMVKEGIDEGAPIGPRR